MASMKREGEGLRERGSVPTVTHGLSTLHTQTQTLTSPMAVPCFSFSQPPGPPWSPPLPTTHISLGPGIQPTEKNVAVRSQVLSIYCSFLYASFPQALSVDLCLFGLQNSRSQGHLNFRLTTQFSKSTLLCVLNYRLYPKLQTTVFSGRICNQYVLNEIHQESLQAEGKKEANNSKKKKSIKQNKKVGERTGFKGRVNV